MSTNNYEYGPDDELPTGKERREKHGFSGGIPYRDIHPDNDTWPSHSMDVQKTWTQEIKPKIEDVAQNGGTMLVNADSRKHANIRLAQNQDEPVDEIPMEVRLAVDMAGWEIASFNGYDVHVYDPDGPLTGEPR